MDITIYDKDPKVFISNALSPAMVNNVITNIPEKSSYVIVPDDQLSLAIGREGQNVRLAARLTGWKIDIKGESEYLKNPGFYDAYEISGAEKSRQTGEQDGKDPSGQKETFGEEEQEAEDQE